MSSSGQASYEDKYNSGIGSNGLTLARHGVLAHDYYLKYPECYAPEIDEQWVFFGQHQLLDPLPSSNISVGEAILSPTRTYVPILFELFNENRSQLHAIYHNTGGGQSKCMKFGQKLHYIKDNMFSLPPFFKLIQESSQTPFEEMYQVFNMGHRMEIATTEDFASIIIKTAKKFNVDAQIVGHIEESPDQSNHLTIESSYGKFKY